jgi:hypothetical protein
VTHEQLAILAAVGILLAVIGIGVAVWALLRARAAVDAARSCLGVAHSHRATSPNPPRHLAVDRRERDAGPPEGVDDRRRHRAPEDARARRRDVDDPGWRVQTAPQAATRPPMPEETHPPTRDMRTLPPPGTAIR